MFFNKLNPIVLDFYTFDPSAYEYAQPTIGKTKPKWLSNLCPIITQQKPGMPAGYVEKFPTAIYCPAIRDMINEPISIPSWYETELVVSNGTWMDVKGPVWGEKIEQHTNNQVGDNFYKDRIFLKLISPWKGICKDPVNFLYLPNFYGSDFFDTNDIVVPTGYTNFKYQNSTNIHLWVKNKPEPYSIQLPIRTPLLSLVPITERKVIIRNHLVDFSTWYSMGSPNPKVSIGAYYKKLKLIKEILK